MRQFMNGLCLAFAFVCIILGSIGIVLPLLPTTPFFLLAAALFAKGSVRFHKWFLSTRLYKNHLSLTFKNKEMTLKNKVSLIATVTILFAAGIFLAPIWHLKLVIFLVLLVHYYIFLFRFRTIPDAKKKEQPCYKEGGE